MHCGCRPPSASASKPGVVFSSMSEEVEPSRVRAALYDYVLLLLDDISLHPEFSLAEMLSVLHRNQLDILQQQDHACTHARGCTQSLRRSTQQHGRVLCLPHARQLLSTVLRTTRHAIPVDTLGVGTGLQPHVRRSVARGAHMGPVADHALEECDGKANRGSQREKPVAKRQIQSRTRSEMNTAEQKQNSAQQASEDTSADSLFRFIPLMPYTTIHQFNAHCARARYRLTRTDSTSV